MITASSTKAERSRTVCDGCDDDGEPQIADYEIRADVGDEYMSLCDECALKLVKALSAVMSMNQPSMKRRLGEFFGTSKRKSTTHPAKAADD